MECLNKDLERMASFSRENSVERKQNRTQDKSTFSSMSDVCFEILSLETPDDDRQTEIDGNDDLQK